MTIPPLFCQFLLLSIGKFGKNYNTHGSRKLNNVAPIYAIFSFCTRKQDIFALVEFLEQSQLLDFCVTLIPKISVIQGPSVGFVSLISIQIYGRNFLKTPSVLERL